MRLLALLVALSGCGLERLSTAVYDHQMAAANYRAEGDEARAAAELRKADEAQVKLQRREYGVPPTPAPFD